MRKAAEAAISRNLIKACLSRGRSVSFVESASLLHEQMFHSRHDPLRVAAKTALADRPVLLLIGKAISAQGA
jgi:siroheme synthase